ncbi:unnamed protein product [Pieris macdunnoughi]|uniref:Uncharacterized protein n=1 Tax=Pieris macdunnoughi TaxID=345717 RepID=A0A821Y7H1_9NEOP|nr:unnamed protein product [Pieris macdunnoughi]
MHKVVVTGPPAQPPQLPFRLYWSTICELNYKRGETLGLQLAQPDVINKLIRKCWFLQKKCSSSLKRGLKNGEFTRRYSRSYEACRVVVKRLGAQGGHTRTES